MSKIKVLPVYPKFPTTFWGFQYALPYVGKKSSMPPTGLATAITMLSDQFESQRIIDLNVEPLTNEQLDSADLIFTSSMLIQEPSHTEIVKRAHERGKKVVSGGPFPTSYPEKTAGADYLVTGEAEITLRPFLEDLVNGNPQKIYTEDNSRDRSSAKLTKTNRVDLQQTPIPKWDLLDLNNYASAAIQFSRGCPFNCDFCDITKLFGRESRTKTPKQMVAELDALYNTGFQGSVFIVDDNFIGNRDNVRNLLPAVTEWQSSHNYPFPLFTEASMDLAWDKNSDILEGMVEAGFDSVFLGIESIDPEVLKKMKKGQNTKLSQLESVRRIQNSGLEVMGGFIIGSDGEKPESSENLYNFIQESGIPVAMPGLLTALKGTDLYTNLERQGRIRGESSGNNTHYLGFNFEPDQDEKKLIEGYKNLIGKLFDPKNYYERCKVLQENQGLNKSNSKRGLNGAKAFFTSLRKQLFAPGGMEYAKYLLNTAKTNPSYIPNAVTQAIKLDHFNTITNETLRADDFVPQVERLSERFKEKAKIIYENTGKDLERRVKRISNLGKRILLKAEKKYHELHEDFRSNAEQALEKFRRNVPEIIKSYQEERPSSTFTK